jgi:hypothetical protein
MAMVKRYVVRRWESSGIEEMEGALKGDLGFFVARDSRGYGDEWYIPNEVFQTEAEARASVLDRAKRRLVKLDERRRRIEAIIAQVSQ